MTAKSTSSLAYRQSEADRPVKRDVPVRRIDRRTSASEASRLAVLIGMGALRVWSKPGQAHKGRRCLSLRRRETNRERSSPGRPRVPGVDERRPAPPLRRRCVPLRPRRSRPVGGRSRGLTAPKRTGVSRTVRRTSGRERPVRTYGDLLEVPYEPDGQVLSLRVSACPERRLSSSRVLLVGSFMP